MIEMTVTEFVSDSTGSTQGQRSSCANKHRIARIIPGSAHLTAIEAMGDLYRTLPEDAAKGWLDDSRTKGTVARRGTRSMGVIVDTCIWIDVERGIDFAGRCGAVHG